MSEPHEPEISDVHRALHLAWLAVHVRRFDAQPDNVQGNPRGVARDRFYSGISSAERAIEEVAEKYGIEWLELRQPRDRRDWG